MKYSIYLLSIIVVVTFSSCSKGYSHEKIVTNNSRNSITVYSGCCDNVQKFIIQPGESETVFACIYQQISKPSKTELSWEIELIKEGYTMQLNQPEEWMDKSKGHLLQYEYVVVD
jgi:hypothetical protein